MAGDATAHRRYGGGTRTGRPRRHHREGLIVRRPTSRGLSALGILVSAAALAGSSLAGCSGGASSDPYELALQSTKAAWSPVQINIGLKATSNGQAVTIDPASIAIVIDKDAGKGAFHLSLPAAGLDIPPAALAQLGITGASIDMDIVDDGQALYAKSPLFKPMLTVLLGQSGKLPAGDLTGWLKLGTNAELGAFGAMNGGGTAKPSASATAETAASLKKSLEDVGITLTLAGTEKHNGADAQHLKVAIDSAKLANNPNFAAGAGQNYAMAAAALKQLTLTGDLWIDAGSKRVVEADLHMVQTTGGSDAADIAITAREPDGSVTLAGPSSAIEMPIQTLFSQLLQLMSKSIAS
jgi:hypothetical protein